MNTTVTTSIDQALCIGCGACVRVCPQDTISIVDGRAKVTGARSLNCGHCEAVCPTGAISVVSLDPRMQEFTGFTMNRDWREYGCGGTAELARLMASRRSTRHYTGRDMPAGALEDLVKIGCLAPSSTNSQVWTWSILPSRAHLLAVGFLAMEFFEKLNRMAANPFLRAFSGQLRFYHREYAAQVAGGIAEFKSGKRDMLFHGAPAAIVIGAKPGGSGPCEDAMLASQNLMLAAHTMGYGTCLIGMAVEASRHDPRIHAALGFKPGERIYSMIVVGEPDETWRHVAGRMTADIRTADDIG